MLIMCSLWLGQCTRTSRGNKEIWSGGNPWELVQLCYLFDFNSEIWTSTSSSAEKDVTHLPVPRSGVTGIKSDTTTLVERMTCVMPQKWLGLLAASNQLLEKSGGRQITYSCRVIESSTPWENVNSIWDWRYVSIKQAVLNPKQLCWWDIVGVRVTTDGLCFSLSCFLYSKYCCELAYGSSDVWMKCNSSLWCLQLEGSYLESKGGGSIEEDRDTMSLKGIAFSLQANKLWHSGPLPTIIPSNLSPHFPFKRLGKSQNGARQHLNCLHSSVVPADDIISDRIPLF